nr:AAA family ATPase [Candidatus Njordarchaeota archaeon]
MKVWRATVGEVTTIHSFKGGSGKTVVASNLALVLAQRGRSVVLPDFDFKAPSLFTIFRPMKDFKYWLNDWSSGGCSMVDALVDLSEHFNLHKRLLRVGFADSRGESIKRSLQEHLTPEAQASFYQHAVGDFNNLIKDGVDFVLLDTSPGFSYTSLAAILSCERLILVTRTDELDLDGTVKLIKSVYNVVLRKKVLLVVNHAPPQILLNPGEGEKLKEEIVARLNLRITTLIPCYCDLAASRGRNLIVHCDPEHGFSKNISVVADHLLRRREEDERVDGREKDLTDCRCGCE